MVQNFYVHQDSKANPVATFIPDCLNDAGKKEAAVMHSITDVKHDQLIKYHFGANTPISTTIYWQNIADEIKREVSPGVPPTHLEITWDAGNNIISVLGKDGASFPSPTDVDYSVCLFHGIDLLDGAIDEFVFTRAKDRDGSDTVVFRSVKNGKAVRHYDVSNDKP